MCVIDDTENYAYIDNTAFKFPNPNIDVQKKSYIVQDTRYNIFSVHDLPLLQNTHWPSMYPKSNG